MRLNLGHIVFMIILILIGVTFSNSLRKIPGVSYLPQY
jgi:hypothetical protein